MGPPRRRAVIRPLHRAEIPIIATTRWKKASAPASSKSRRPRQGRLRNRQAPQPPRHRHPHAPRENQRSRRPRRRRTSWPRPHRRAQTLRRNPQRARPAHQGGTYENTVGFSERANEAIEPRLSEQWFMRYPNIPEALALLRDGHVKFHPNTGPRFIPTGSKTSRIGASPARSVGASHPCLV